MVRLSVDVHALYVAPPNPMKHGKEIVLGWLKGCFSFVKISLKGFFQRLQYLTWVPLHLMAKLWQKLRRAWLDRAVRIFAPLCCNRNKSTLL